VKTLRPHQWTKNVLLLAALVFDVKLFNPYYVVRALGGLLLFSLASGAVYIFNDLVDLEKDRHHPSKRHRPLPAGELSPTLAAVTATTLAVGSLVVDATISPWLYICTTLLALFLALSKRRGELVALRDEAVNHRPILEHYNLTLLDQLIGMMTSSTILAYALYTFSAPNLPQDYSMMLTIPFVIYGLFRYVYLIHQEGCTLPPDEVLLKDRPSLVNILLWGLTVVGIMYLGRTSA